MELEFDVIGFLDALGSKARIAQYLGVARTAPYGWERRRYLSSAVMARLVEYSRWREQPLDVNDFIRRKKAEPKPVYIRYSRKKKSDPDSTYLTYTGKKQGKRKRRVKRTGR